MPSTIVIIAWAICLEGAGNGIRLYTTPDFNKIRNIEVWIAAHGQIFFYLSLGFGIMIAYASYLPKKKVGQGSVFFFYLPASQKAVHEVRAESERLAMGSESILLVPA